MNFTALYLFDIYRNNESIFFHVTLPINTVDVQIIGVNIMNNRYPTKKLKSFRLPSYVVLELEKVAKDCDTTKTAIVELAIMQFSARIEALRT